MIKINSTPFPKEFALIQTYLVLMIKINSTPFPKEFALIQTYLVLIIDSGDSLLPILAKCRLHC